MTLEQPNVEKEPIDLFRDSVLLKLQELYPGKNVGNILESFIIDILRRKNIPSSLDRMLPEKQKEFLLKGEDSLDVAINNLLKDIPEDVLDFYRKKIENQTSRKFDILDEE